MIIFQQYLLFITLIHYTYFSMPLAQLADPWQKITEDKIIEVCKHIQFLIKIK